MLSKIAGGGTGARPRPTLLDGAPGVEPPPISRDEMPSPGLTFFGGLERFMYL